MQIVNVFFPKLENVSMELICRMTPSIPKYVLLAASIWAEAQHFLQDLMCTQRRLSSACASVQGDQRLCYSPEDAFDPWLPIERPAMTDQPARMRRLIWVLAERTSNLVGNAVDRLIL